MSSFHKKRPRLIEPKETIAELQPWSVRTSDGRVRGPVGMAGLKSLLEVGILNGAAVIARSGEEDWTLITKHPIWEQLQPQSKPLKLKSELGEGATADPFLVPTSPVSEERRLKMEALRQRELNSSHQRLVWWQLGHLLRACREVLIFLGFVTAGDLATSFFDSSIGLVKWAVLLCLTCLAVMYYSFRAMSR